MNYIDLYEKLPEKDKQTLINYIDKFGVLKSSFVGLENWLQNWSHSKQKLYKLLGNQFIKEYDYEFKKSEIDLEKEFCNILFKLPFRKSYFDFCHNIVIPLYKDGKMSYDTLSSFKDVINLNNFIDNKITHEIKYKKEGVKKCLQIQAGAKPIKALNKIVNYFKDDYNFEGFEDFRIQHSILSTTSIVKGKICFSIHPLDFLTMSDNGYNWSSCMSWMDHGCYHVGTIEMMNSNNVVCCYLKSNDPFIFNYNSDDENNKWNNKRWRILTYITKDIIMSGKAYPYRDDDLSKKVISIVKNLAFNNMNWTYSYGPELYQDMKYINTMFTIDRVHSFIARNNTKKHNIIWNTNGMYNDMLNDHKVNYWCYRNKVNKTKLLSVSGKANCLCCNNSIIKYNEDYADEYNERFDYCGSSICEDCYNKLKCNFCNSHQLHKPLYKVKIKDEEISICEDCLSKRIKICPDCGKPMMISNSQIIYPYKDFVKDEAVTYMYAKGYPWRKDMFNSKQESLDKYEDMFLCEECFQKQKNNFIEQSATSYPYHVNTFFIFNKKLNESINPKKYFYHNLKFVPYDINNLVINKNANSPLYSLDFF